VRARPYDSHGNMHHTTTLINNAGPKLLIRLDHGVAIAAKTDDSAVPIRSDAGWGHVHK
jgi:hypothetical protein